MINLIQLDQLPEQLVAGAAKAAIHCGVDSQTIHRYMRNGLLPSTKVGNVYLFECQTLDAWNARRLAGEFGRPGHQRKEAAK